MRSPALLATLVLAIGGATVAIAQNGPPEDPGAIAAEASAFGKCVADAAKAGETNPQEACADLKPGGGNESDDEGNGGPAEDTHPGACQGEPKEDGSFGKCVSERASAFGRCVAEAAKAGNGNPTAACADLKPSNGGGNGEANGGEGTPNGPPEGVPTGKPSGTPSGPPEGVPTGKPSGTPSGKPETPPSGKPEGTPSGPPEGVPQGKPEGTPGGPPSA